MRLHRQEKITINHRATAKPVWLAGLACGLFLFNANCEGQQISTRNAEVDALMQSIVGTWVLAAIDSSGHGIPAAGAYETAPQGLLTIDADGNYMMLLACKEQPGDRSGSQKAATACDRNSHGSYAHSGRLWSSGATIHFQIDHSSVKSLEGNDLSTGYRLDGRQLTLAFDSTEKETSAGMRGEVAWHRLSGSLPSTPTVIAAQECSLFHHSPLDRSDINEARVDQ